MHLALQERGRSRGSFEYRRCRLRLALQLRSSAESTGPGAEVREMEALFPSLREPPRVFEHRCLACRETQVLPLNDTCA